MKYCSQCRKNTRTITVYDDINDEQHDNCCPICGADLTYSEFQPLDKVPVAISNTPHKTCALERICVNVLEYYASEIDKHAISVTMHNYPNTR